MRSYSLCQNLTYLVLSQITAIGSTGGIPELSEPLARIVNPPKTDRERTEEKSDGKDHFRD